MWYQHIQLALAVYPTVIQTLRERSIVHLLRKQWRKWVESRLTWTAFKLLLPDFCTPEDREKIRDGCFQKDSNEDFLFTGQLIEVLTGQFGKYILQACEMYEQAQHRAENQSQSRNRLMRGTDPMSWKPKNILYDNDRGWFIAPMPLSKSYEILHEQNIGNLTLNDLKAWGSSMVEDAEAIASEDEPFNGQIHAA